MENYLERAYVKMYAGIKDDFEAAFERWLAELDADELINYANAYAAAEVELALEAARLTAARD